MDPTGGGNPYETPLRSGRLETPITVVTPATRSTADVMKDYELFGVVVRASALPALAYGFWQASGALAPAAGFSPLDYVPGAIAPLLYGFACLFGADLIVAVAYHSGFREHRTYSSADDIPAQPPTS